MSADAWSYFDAALVSSSYLKMGRIMSWLTGNIGDPMNLRDTGSGAVSRRVPNREQMGKDRIKAAFAEC